MRTKPLLLILPLLLGACVYAGCVYEDATDEQPSETPAAQPSQTRGYSVPIGAAEYDTAALEQGRLDPAWRQWAERDRLERLGTAPAPASEGQSPLTTGSEPPPPTGAEGAGAPATPPTPRRAGSESYEQISADGLSGAPALPLGQEGGGPTVLRAQILLDRARFSPGVIDGNWGKNTAKAVYWFQFAKGLNATGEVDQGTWDALSRSAAGAAGAGDLLTRVQVTAEDLKGPWVDPLPDDPYQQAELECLCYSSPLELFGERGHATPELIQKLNSEVDFANLQAGTEIVLPNVLQVSPEDVSSKGGARATPAANHQGAQAAPAAGGEVARLLISKRGFYLQALDAQGHILYHFPSTLGSKYDPSATGTLQITGIHPEPGFHYQPKLFADVSDDKPEAQIPAGPNSPVGLVWLDLSKPHHGIHGTASPETIGYTSSHGCVRLTNWDALFLAQHVKSGTQVVFRE